MLPRSGPNGTNSPNTPGVSCASASLTATRPAFMAHIEKLDPSLKHGLAAAYSRGEPRAEVRKATRDDHLPDWSRLTIFRQERLARPGRVRPSPDDPRRRLQSSVEGHVTKTQSWVEEGGALEPGANTLEQGDLLTRPGQRARHKRSQQLFPLGPVGLLDRDVSLIEEVPTGRPLSGAGRTPRSAKGYPSSLTRHAAAYPSFGRVVLCIGHAEFPGARLNELSDLLLAVRGRFLAHLQMLSDLLQESSCIHGLDQITVRSFVD